MIYGQKKLCMLWDSQQNNEKEAIYNISIQMKLK